jgi:intracellular sulfur oxidation DsrE/DsrF family protein
MSQKKDPSKRTFLTWISGISMVLGAGSVKSKENKSNSAGLHQDTKNKIVYQLNRSEPEHIEHILNSINAMLKKYTDDVAIAVVAFGPGIHLLATKPERTIPLEQRKRIKGMAEFYDVDLVACGNTMKSLKWSQENIIPEARIEEVGAASIMQFQQKGYAYIAW